MSLFVAFFLPLVIALGIWQLGRAAEKRAFEEAFLANVTALPERVGEADGNAAGQPLSRPPFSRLRLRGTLGEEVFLVDNQVRERALGYWVVQVLHEQSGRRFLVNRGFVAAPERREALPEIPVTGERVDVVGFVWPYTGLVPLLEDEVWNAGWPKRVQRLNVAAMASAVDAEPFEIRLESHRDWAPAPAPLAGVLKDDVHLGYAATWFGLALALIILFGVYGYRRATMQRDEA